jgi:hypothetical protein
MDTYLLWTVLVAVGFALGAGAANLISPIKRK